MYSITFTISFFAGIVSALGMVLHEFLEVIIAYVLLLRSGISERRVLWLALCAVAFTTPLDTLLSYQWIANIDQPFLGDLMVG